MIKRTEKKFIDLINANMGIIYKICYIYERTSDSREDLKQEIIVQLWKSFSSFKADAKFSTWMYRVCLNTAITYVRKSVNQPVMESLFENISDDQTWEYQEEKYEKLSSLYAAISKLNEIEKAIIMLYLEEKTYLEIAELVGISEKNVSVKLVRTKNKLIKLV